MILINLFVNKIILILYVVFFEDIEASMITILMLDRKATLFNIKKYIKNMEKY